MYQRANYGARNLTPHLPISATADFESERRRILRANVVLVSGCWTFTGSLCHYSADGVSDLLASPSISLGQGFPPAHRNMGPMDRLKASPLHLQNLTSIVVMTAVH